ncbi:MAG: hypothetical protein ACLPUT_04855 [Solirubrobacteraceae bacterium]
MEPACAGTALACALVACVLPLVSPGAALAAVGHNLLSSLSEGPVGKPLSEPGAVAVDHATGDVFVADPGRGVVDVFSSNGSFVTRFGEDLEAAAVAVDEASGDVYIAEPVDDAVVVFKPDGSGKYVQLSQWSGAATPGAGFGEVVGVAVDNSTSGSDPSAGDVYVVDAESLALVEGESEPSGRGAVDVFKPRPAGPEEGQEGEFVRALGGVKKGEPSVKLEEPNGAVVSVATGRVYVADSVKGLIYTFSSSGAFEEKLKGSGSPLGSFRGKEAEEGNVTALAIDETTGDLLVAEAERDVVSEFNGSGEWVGWVTSTPSGPFGEVSGIAVGASGDVYIADRILHAVDVFGPDVMVPSVETNKASKAQEPTAVLNGKVSGDGAQASYHFELGETEAYGGLSTTVMHTTGGGEEAVRATVTGLKAGTKYYYRLVAGNENGTSCGIGRWFIEGGEETGQAVSVACRRPSAAIDDESATQVAATSATLQSQIDPNGHDTAYQFQYGTESCRGNPGACTDAPSEPADIGSGEVAVADSVQLQGLQPDTTYYYRVVASNSLGTSDGIERTFTTQSSSASFALPDHRAWELVTPPDKHGAPVEALTKEGGWIFAAEDGDAITYVAKGAVTEQAEGNRSLELQQVLATRGTSEWSSQDIATPQTKALGQDLAEPPEYQFFSPDLSLALVDPYNKALESQPPLAPDAVQSTMYLRDNPPLRPGEDEAEAYAHAAETYEHAKENGETPADYPGYLPLVTEANVAQGTEFGGELQFVDATPDLSHVVLYSKVALAGPSSGPGLYEWSTGTLQPVSVLPDGESAGPEVALGYHNVHANAISDDGTRVIWTASRASRGHLYMRDTVTGTTIMLDAVPGLPEQEQPTGEAQFQTASSDGSRVLFTDTQRLTADSTADSKSDDLYECEIVEERGESTCRLQDLTAGVVHAGEHAAVQSLLFGSSKDCSSAYLVAHGVLATNENGEGEKARDGEENLYELHYNGKEANPEWTITFVAALAESDSVEWEGGANVEGSEGSAGLADTSYLTARVSPNGRYLAFMSQKSLTGYDNEDVSSEKPKERLDEEVYLYDSHSASLTCVSCDPTGARPVGVLDEGIAGEGIGLLVDRRLVWKGHWLAGNIPGWTAQSDVSALLQSRYLSDEGRLFFDSADALVAQVTSPTREEEVEEDVDGHKQLEKQKVGVENVYEYEPAGVGSCESATGGCVALISSGGSSQESAFLEATPSGDDAFFLTAAQLSPQDTDPVFDIYDARVCTQESPCLTPPRESPAGCSEADACRPAPPAQQAPIGPSGSASFSGPGNLAAPAGKQEVKGVKTGVHAPTAAQKLAAALAACKRLHPHSKKKRQACEAQARKRYGPKKKAKKGATARKSSGGLLRLAQGGHR